MAEEKDGKKKKQTRLYTTEIINNLLKDNDEGYDVDMYPFYEGETDLRAAKVTFRMTEEESIEYEKCFNDALYFISKYCKFMTDSGRKVVNLRDYQKDIIKLVTDQHYDETIDEMAPDNRNLIMCCSRQIGKCLIISELRDLLKVGLQPFSYSYYNKKGKNLLIKIKLFLYKIYNLL